MRGAMPPPQQFEPPFLRARKTKVAVALALTFSSGIVDIVGYLGLFHLFTAHLTGDTVQLGRSLAEGLWTQALAVVAIVGAFVVGSLFGRVAIEIASRRGFRRVASVTLATEILLVLAVTLSPHVESHTAFWRLAFLAAAMGVQTATLTRIGPLTVHTTFVTGMVNKTAQLLSHIFLATYDIGRATTDGARAGLRAERTRDAEMAAFLACVWSFYVAGAAFGTWAFNALGVHALFAAIAILVAALAIDGISPLSIEEEKEQSER
jgi:uncharacterized membrane protein YoaK (UPF0700 family)